MKKRMQKDSEKRTFCRFADGLNRKNLTTLSFFLTFKTKRIVPVVKGDELRGCVEDKVLVHGEEGGFFRKRFGKGKEGKGAGHQTLLLLGTIKGHIE